LITDVALVLEHSIEADVSPAFAWTFRTVRDVQTERSFAIEMLLDRATLRFEWRFGAISERRTKLTQRIILSGSNDAAYVEHVEAGFGSTLQGGMERIAAEMIAAEQAG
jgi:hypothetical protein